MAQLKLNEASVKALELAEGEVQAYFWDERTTGFGVVVGAQSKTFVARAWVKGKRRRVKLGTWPETSVDDARAAALTTLGKMATGVDPNAAKRAAGGPTLADALKFHLGRMERGENRRRKPCSKRSIDSIRDNIELHLVDYLDEPLVALTADELDKVRERIESTTKRRGNAVNPPGRATGIRLLANVSAIWRSYHKRHGLPVACPVDRLTPGALAPRVERVGNDELAAWHTKVKTLTPIRRDLQLVSMFSGVRADGVRHLRWEDVDFDEELVQITHAKGGRPYSIPLTETLRDIFEARQEANAADPFLIPYGGDDGWVFPSVSRDGENVIALAEPKEYRLARDAKGKLKTNAEGDAYRERFLPGTHPNRRTYNSVAIEVGVPLEVRERLMNHSGKGVNVKHYGVPQDWTLTREWADKIEAAIWVRIRGELKPKGKRKLRAV